MDAERKSKLEKIERYFRNATRFLWGLGKDNQRETYKWLQGTEGLKFVPGSYGNVIDQLMREPGIEQIIEKIIKPRVKDLFTDSAIEYLRDCWQRGERPTMPRLRDHNLEKEEIRPFVEINFQYGYVEKWGELAGVWFEEIEKLEE